MSPPTKAPPEPELGHESAGTTRNGAGPAPARASGIGGPQGAVLDAQRTAGNQAVVAALRAGRGVQRAPNDDGSDDGGPVPDPADVRAQRVAEGLGEMEQRTAARVQRANVQPINDPEEAARVYLDQRGAAGGNIAVGRNDAFRSKWRYDHHQHVPAPAAGWRNADGTVVIDKSNPQVKEAVERLARERGGSAGSAPPPAPPGSSAPPPPPASPGQRPVPATTGVGTAPPPRPDRQPLAQTGVGTSAPPPGPGPAGERGPRTGSGGSAPQGPAFQPALPGTPGGGPARAWPNPQAVPPGQFGGVDPNEKVTPIPKPREAMQAEVEPLGQIDPRRVIKSRNENWHYNAWHHSKGPYYYGENAPAPKFFKVGDTYYASPEYDGPGTVLPNYSGTEGAGLGKPATGGPTPPPAPQSDRPASPPNKLRQAVAPFTPFTGQPLGTQRAQPVTRTEVMNALAADPSSVVRTPDNKVHRQGYRLDGGGREAPGAYRVGNLYVISHDYPVPGVPKLSVPGSQPPGGTTPTQAGGAPGGPGASAGPPPAPGAAAAAPDPTKATQTISPTGYVPQERKRAKWDVKGGELSRETAQEEKRTTEQGTDTRTRSSKKGYSIAKGAGQEWKQRDESQTGDGFTAKERSTKVNASLAGLALNRGSATETGTTPDGPKTKTERNIGGSLGPEGAGGTASTAITSQTGMKAEAKGDVKIGPDGIELTGTGTITTPKGFTGHLSVSGKSSVVAKDPKPMPNGQFAVDFVMTDQNGVELGGGWSKPGGGMSVGVEVGSSTTTSNYQTRVFNSKEEALLFQLTAAMEVSADTRSFEKATSADDVLSMKEGEVRGTSKTDTDSLGGSAGMSVVSVGVNSTESTTTGLKIQKMAGNKVRVTPSIAEQEALNASISVAGKFGNTKGESTTKSFSVTYEFDLGTEGGKLAYENYKKNRLPPPMPPHAKWIDTTTGLAMEDHDTYKFAHVGEIGWGSHATQQTVVDEGGTHTTAVGGKTEKVQLNAIRKLTFDKNRHAEANIIGRMTNGQITSLAGQLTVGGEDGAFNRDQFRQIFSDKGAPAGAEVKSSGEWTLSAEIDKKVFEDLTQLRDDMKDAKTREERLKIYSELARKGGAEMIGGQVRQSGRKLAWNLELKGDPNFPGPSGRAALNQQRAKLQARLKERPDSAGSIASEAKSTLDALEKRLKAVSDESKYTDLPTELRNEQKDLISGHIAEFKSVRSQALSVQMRGGRKEDLTVVLKRAAGEHGYQDVKKEDRGWRKAQDLVSVHETEVHALEVEIARTRDVVQRMFHPRGDLRWGQGVHAKVFQEYNEKAKRYYSLARTMAPRLTEAVTKMREIKNSWDGEADPKAREEKLRAYDRQLLETIKIMDIMLVALRDTAREAYIVTTESIVEDKSTWKLWEQLKVDRATRGLAINTESGVIPLDEL